MTHRAFVTIALATLIGISAHGAEFSYSATHGPSCTDIVSKPELSSWRCSGPHGYSAMFVDAVTVVGVRLGPTDKEKSIDDGDLTWRAATSGHTLGDHLEWRTAHGRPYAAILRIWRNDPDPHTGKDQIIEELLVTKVSAQGACRVGTVNAKQRDANITARDLADSTAATFRCGIDKPKAM